MFGALHLSTYRGFEWAKHNTTDGASVAPETLVDMDSGTFASYFSDWDPNSSPKVLITTLLKAMRVTRNSFEELVGVFPGAEFVRRKERGFEMGRIAG